MNDVEFTDILYTWDQLLKKLAGFFLYNSSILNYVVE